MAKNENQSRDDVLRRMLKAPPKSHGDMVKERRAKADPDRLAKLVESDDPENFEEIARELRQKD